MGGVLSARGVGRDAIVGARPPLGGHVLQRASVDVGLKPYVSAQRGSNKHTLIIWVAVSLRPMIFVGACTLCLPLFSPPGASRLARRRDSLRCVIPPYALRSSRRAFSVPLGP